MQRSCRTLERMKLMMQIILKYFIFCLLYELAKDCKFMKGHYTSKSFLGIFFPKASMSDCLLGFSKLLLSSDSDDALKCNDNWRVSQVTFIAEEALSVLSQPTSCCDNVSVFPWDNTHQTQGRREQLR